jgi:hypothetical protein
MTTDEEVQSLLDQADQADAVIAEFHISQDILEIVRKHGQDMAGQPPRTVAAHVALRFLHGGKDEADDWRTHFRPFAVWRGPGGTVLVEPNPTLLVGPVAAELKGLACAARNPALRARYYDVLWDMSPKFTMEQRQVEWASHAIDGYLAACEGRLWKNLPRLRDGLARAADLAITTPDAVRMGQVKRVALALSEPPGEDSLQLRLLAFDVLWENRKKLGLNADEELRVVRVLEDEFRPLTTTTPGAELSTNALEACTIRLARYYQAKQTRAELERVLRAYNTVMDGLLRQAEPLVAMVRLEEVHAVLHQFGMIAERDDVARRVEALRSGARANAKPIESKVHIPLDDFERQMEKFTHGSLDECLRRFVASTIRSKSQAQQDLQELMKQAPLSSLVGVHLFDRDGDPVARLGSVVDDPEGRLVHHCGKHISVQSGFVRLGIERLIAGQRINAPQLRAWFADSPVIPESRREVLTWVIDHYFEDDWIGAAHALVTVLEASVRESVRLSGGVVYKQAKGGGLIPCDLDALLRDPSVDRLFGSDAVLYLRTLLTDRRGLNLRNEICHGKVPAEGFNAHTATMVLTGLLLVSMARFVQLKSDQASA